MSRRPRVGIIGAGIGGLTAARALQRNGCGVSLFERSNMLGEVGAGLQVGPSGVKALDALGLAEPLRRIASIPESFLTFDYATGELCHKEPLQARMRRYGAP